MFSGGGTRTTSNASKALVEFRAGKMKHKSNKIFKSTLTFYVFLFGKTLLKISCLGKPFVAWCSLQLLHKFSKELFSQYKTHLPIGSFGGKSQFSTMHTRCLMSLIDL